MRAWPERCCECGRPHEAIVDNETKTAIDTEMPAAAMRRDLVDASDFAR
jgi:hypothetical protein